MRINDNTSHHLWEKIRIFENLQKAFNRGIIPLFFYLERIFNGVNDVKKYEKMRMDCTALKNTIKSWSEKFINKNNAVQKNKNS